MGKILMKNKIINERPRDVSAEFMKTMVGNFNSDKYEFNFPNTLDEYILFLDSEQYEQIPKGTKMALTRSYNSTYNFGYTLMMNTPCLVENIILANSFGILEDYAKIMMSKDGYLSLINKISN
jgi:hypothetical protein